LQVFDLWDNRVRTIRMPPRDTPSSCLTCGQEDFEWLEGRRGTDAVILCGRNSVQIAPRVPTAVNLPDLARRLAVAEDVVLNPYLLRFSVDGMRITVFADGRGIVTGTSDPVVAKSTFSRHVGV
ncbi:MAG TPA: thiazole biosynthesis adenylyltransferase ThiF, partial [Pirellulaceae bacterium]